MLPAADDRRYGRTRRVIEQPARHLGLLSLLVAAMGATAAAILRPAEHADVDGGRFNGERTIPAIESDRAAVHFGNLERASEPTPSAERLMAWQPRPQPVVATERVRSVETSGREYITADVQRSIDRGLEYLASRQNENGSFGSDSSYRANVAVTGLAGMAFLSAGHTPGRGKYGNHVEGAIAYILDRAQPSGYIVEETVRYHGPMYGHGFATLFLAEVYGMSQRREVREALERAVKLIINSQNSEGGWRYYPDSDDADISVTVAQVMALRAARNAGIFVPKNTVDRATEYVKQCQNADGGFRYRLGQRAESLFPRSAAGIVSLYSAGIYEGREIERGLDYLMRYLPQGEVFRNDTHYYYGHYYAVQVMWHAGGDYWHRWYPAIRDEVVRKQLSNGSWSDPQINNEYGTAMACLVLQMPNNYLPIFQR